MGREIRRVTKDWVHPIDDSGKPKPMYNEYYGDVLKQWISDNISWDNGTHKDLISDPSIKERYPFYAMYHGDAPDINYYQIRRYTNEQLTHIQLYETTSEGTPLSPIFRADDLDGLCEWAASNATTFGRYTATKEQWLKMLSEDFVYHQEGRAIFL